LLQAAFVSRLKLIQMDKINNNIDIDNGEGTLALTFVLLDALMQLYSSEITVLSNSTQDKTGDSKLNDKVLLLVDLVITTLEQLVVADGSLAGLAKDAAVAGFLRALQSLLLLPDLTSLTGFSLCLCIAKRVTSLVCGITCQTKDKSAWQAIADVGPDSHVSLCELLCTVVATLTQAERTQRLLEAVDLSLSDTPGTRATTSMKRALADLLVDMMQVDVARVLADDSDASCDNNAELFATTAIRTSVLLTTPEYHMACAARDNIPDLVDALTVLSYSQVLDIKTALSCMSAVCSVLDAKPDLRTSKVCMLLF
jgi:hypothetical protein